MPAYATQAEFEAYAEAYIDGWPGDPAALDRLLERASRDVDALLGPRYPITDGTFEGFKLDPSALRDWEAKALSRATCAQAEYRATLGEEEFAKFGTGGTVSGPDFSVSGPTSSAGGRPRVGPKVRDELSIINHLRVTTARVH